MEVNSQASEVFNAYVQMYGLMGRTTAEVYDLTLQWLKSVDFVSSGDPSEIAQEMASSSLFSEY